MTDIALTAARVAAVFPATAEIYDFVAAATITAGQALYATSAGKVDLYDSNGSGTLQFCGIALNGGGAGQAISVLKRGHVFGYTISGLAYWAPVYGSNTAGALADAAGSSSNVAGVVVPLSDAGTFTKVLYIEAKWTQVYS
jgi:hypothetical protein